MPVKRLQTLLGSPIKYYFINHASFCDSQNAVFSTFVFLSGCAIWRSLLVWWLGYRRRFRFGSRVPGDFTIGFPPWSCRRLLNDDRNFFSNQWGLFRGTTKMSQHSRCVHLWRYLADFQKDSATPLRMNLTWPPVTNGRVLPHAKGRGLRFTAQQNNVSPRRLHTLPCDVSKSTVFPTDGTPTSFRNMFAGAAAWTQTEIGYNTTRLSLLFSQNSYSYWHQSRYDGCKVKFLCNVRRI